MIVVDASALIALAKMGRLRLLRETHGGALIGSLVKTEAVDQGRLAAAPEAVHIELGLEEGWILEAESTPKETLLTESLLKSTRLHPGEAESLALAHVRKLKLVVDDKEARAMARAMGIEHLGTAALLLGAFVSGHLTHDALEDAMRDLPKVTWLSPEVVAEILWRGREAKK